MYLLNQFLNFFIRLQWEILITYDVLLSNIHIPILVEFLRLFSSGARCVQLHAYYFLQNATKTLWKMLWSKKLFKIVKYLAWKTYSYHKKVRPTSGGSILHIFAYNQIFSVRPLHRNPKNAGNATHSTIQIINLNFKDFSDLCNMLHEYAMHLV